MVGDDRRVAKTSIQSYYATTRYAPCISRMVFLLMTLSKLVFEVELGRDAVLFRKERI
jgi:hypothetical protein